MLSDAMKAYLDKNPARFHMPGHKGKPLPLLGDIAKWDLTEVVGLDSLYHADGCIHDTELAYAKLYGTADTVLSAGGGTLCIQAMLALALQPGDALIAGRGVHTAAVNAMALLDLHPIWVMPQTDDATGLSGQVTPEEIEASLSANPAAKAVYLTSPTYYGAIADIKVIADVCHRFGVPLLVDNAHGAHLAFLSESLHPTALGADLCCDSLHKTLPVLTGGALLHIGNLKYQEAARKKMALFGSTSPSYLIMLSADLALPYLQTQIAADIQVVAASLEELAAAAKAKGFLLPEFPLSDPMRLTLGGAPLGYTGEALDTHLRKKGIEPEYAGGGFCVLMASPFNEESDYTRLHRAIEGIPSHQPLLQANLAFTLPQQAVPLRGAVFAESETVPVEDAIGRVAAALVAPCPPGIALLCAGEHIAEDTALLLKSYGICMVDVVK